MSVSCGTVCRLPAVLLGGLPRCRPSAGRGADQRSAGCRRSAGRPSDCGRLAPSERGRRAAGVSRVKGRRSGRADIVRGRCHVGGWACSLALPAAARPCFKGVEATARPRPRCRRRTGTRRTRPRGGSWCAWYPRTRTQRARRRTARAARSRGCSSLHSQWARTARVRP